MQSTFQKNLPTMCLCKNVLKKYTYTSFKEYIGAYRGDGRQPVKILLRKPRLHLIFFITRLCIRYWLAKFLDHFTKITTYLLNSFAYTKKGCFLYVKENNIKLAMHTWKRKKNMDKYIGKVKHGIKNELNFCLISMI